MSEVTISQQYTKEAGETANMIVSFEHLLDKDASINETISSVSSVAVSPSGPTVTNSDVTTVVRKVLGRNVEAGKAVTFTVAGGTNGTTYTLTITVVTSGGQTRVRKITMPVAAA